MPEINDDDTTISTREEETKIDEIEDEPEETVEELKARLQEEREAREKAEKNYQDQRGRNDRLEKQYKEGAAAQPKPTKAEEETLSFKDNYALTQANVLLEDVDEVLEYAKLKKLSVADALKSNVVKAILKDREEMRTTAEATNTGPARRTSGKVSEEALITKAQKGEMPESQEDIDRLVAARRKKK